MAGSVTDTFEGMQFVRNAGFQRPLLQIQCLLKRNAVIRRAVNDNQRCLADFHII